MKLSDWAKKNGLCYQTAFNLFKANKLPCKVTQLATGTILVEEDLLIPASSLKTYVYARVSSHTKKADLDRQAERCLEFCRSSGWEVEKVYKEIASGVNDKRKLLLKLLDKNPKRIVVEHKDRLTRFGFNYFDSILPLLGYQLIVINRDFEEETDLINDIAAVIGSTCCKLHGLEKGKNKAKECRRILK